MLERPPIIIGVSAHRNIDARYIDAVRAEVRNVLQAVIGVCGKRAVMLNGLADGGDLLCAAVAVELGMEIRAALPMAEQSYLNAEDFSQNGLREYTRINNSGCVTEKFVVNAAQNGTRDMAFRAQTEYVASHCTALIALWDGTQSSGAADECGTNLAVRLVTARPDGAVIAVFSPRQGRTYDKAKVDVKYLLPNGKVYSELPQELLKMLA